MHGCPQGVCRAVQEVGWLPVRIWSLHSFWHPGALLVLPLGEAMKQLSAKPLGE